MISKKLPLLVISLVLAGCTLIKVTAQQNEYPANVSLNESSCEITMSGAIDNKAVSSFQQLIQTNKNISKCKDVTVVLSSTGGAVFPAFNLGNMIRAKGYFTKVANNASCISACAVIFIAGNKRYMQPNSPNTKIGFHQMVRTDQSGSTCVDISENTALITSYKDYVKKMLPEKAAIFYTENISNVSCRSVKYYTAEELQQYGIVTNYY